MRLYNVYASGQTRKGLPPIRCLERWRKDGRYFRQRTHVWLYNLYASFQTRKGIPPIRCLERWRKDGRYFRQRTHVRLYILYASFQTRKGIPPIRWPEICGYITFTQVFRHGKVYRRSDVWNDGGKMADISASEHICGYIIFTQAFRHGKVYRRSVGRKYAVI